jgi:hypothetical protein
MPLERDVFISYSHSDKAWVTTVLLPKLELHGFSVMIDLRDFQSGAFGIEEMERAIEQCRKVLLVLTRHYVESEWCRFENALAQTLDPGASARKMIPVVKERCDLPLRLRAIQHRDLSRGDDAEWDLLTRDLI